MLSTLELICSHLINITSLLLLPANLGPVVIAIGRLSAQMEAGVTHSKDAHLQKK
jgi:hypothetical protein